MSNPNKELLEQVKTAFDALHQPSDKRNANAWLIEFERLPSAWNIAPLLINDPSYRFFGANMLHNKIRHDIEQLPRESVFELKSMIIQQLINISQEATIDKAFGKRLCLAIAALALQLNQTGIIRDILNSLNAIVNTAPLLILELLSVLPEECFDKRVYISADIRNLFAKQLVESTPEIFHFLLTLLDTLQPQTSTKNQILICLGRWIETLDIPEDFLSTHHICHFIINSLSNRELFEEAVEALIVMIRKYSRSKTNLIALQVLPPIIALRPLWDSNKIQNNQQDDDVCRSLCRLFTEFAESHLDLLLTDASLNYHHIFSQLLECLKFPWDYDIARIPLNLFTDLSIIIRNSNDNQQLKSRFEFIFQMSIDISILAMKLPYPVLLGAEKMEDDKKDQRLDFLDMVTVSCDILSGDVVMSHICQTLQSLLSQSLHHHQQQQQQQTPGTSAVAPQLMECYSNIEACLVCLQAVAAYISPKEACYIPQIMSSLSSLPPLPGITITVIKLIGNLSHWIYENETFMLPTFLHLSQCLDNQATQSFAAEALMQLCRACASRSTLPATDLHNQIVRLRKEDKLPVQDDNFLLEGLCYVISSLSTQACTEALQYIIEPMAVSLQAAVDTSTAASTPSTHRVIEDIDRVTTALRFTCPVAFNGTIPSPAAPSTSASPLEQHPVMSVFLLIWPILRSVIQKYQSEFVYERVGRCYKYTIRNVSASFAPCLPDMTSHLAEGFALTYSSSFLYAGAICFSEFAGNINTNNNNSNSNNNNNNQVNGKMTEILYNMIWSFSQSFFKQFYSLEEFEKRPDVIEEYFYLLARALELCPAPLLSSSQFMLLIQAGVTGLRLKHREAQKGVLFFFEKLVELPFTHYDDQSIQSVIFELLNQCSGILVNALFLSLSGQLPVYAIDGNNGSIADVLWCIRRISHDNMKVCIQQSLLSLPPYVKEEADRLRVVDAILSASHRKDFNITLDNFERACRRRANAN